MTITTAIERFAAWPGLSASCPGALALAALVVSSVTATASCNRTMGGDSSRRPDRALEERFPLAALDDRTLCDRLLARTSNKYALFADPAPERRRKVIVSDLHLGPGDHAGPRFSGLEDFRFHREWGEFLVAQGWRGPTDLVIAGDFIEFWQILGALDRLPDSESEVQRDRELLLAADQDSALEALEYVLVAHREVFAHIGRFLASGDHRVIILSGNHDAELLWPRVRLAIVRAIRPRDPVRILFVDATGYQHGGVHIEHGHRFDSANRFTTPHAPFGRDSTGRCRLQSSWGAVFVAHFFNATEREFPFVDNLYPESAAVLWGLRDEPNTGREVVTVARFLDLLISAESRQFNLSALSGALRSIAGLPARSDDNLGTGEELVDHLITRLSSNERLFDGLMLLLNDPELRVLWSALVRAAGHLPDIRRSVKELEAVDPSALERVRGLFFGDPMTSAAQQILERFPHIRTVVVGHSHLPGGTVKDLTRRRRTGYYANTGAWIPVLRVRDIKDRGVSFGELSVLDRSVFPALFPAVVIEYDGDTPRPPVIEWSGERSGHIPP